MIGHSLLTPWTAYTAHALQRSNHSVTVVYSTSLTLDRLTLHKGAGDASRIPLLNGGLTRCRQAWHRWRDGRLAQIARKTQPHLILILWGNSLSPELLQSLKTLTRCPLVTWWVDDPFRHNVEKLLPFYDLFYIFDRSYMAPLKQAGAREVRFLPCACDDTVYYPRHLSRAERKRYTSDVALVAWYYSDRASIVKALTDLDIKIWGRGWTSPEARQLLNGTKPIAVHGERFVRDETASKIYSATKIGLNIHSDQTREAGLNTRAFELLAAGAFQLVDEVHGMAELLAPGKEVAVYHSPQEARSLADYYLRHSEERIRMAQMGRIRTLNEHTYLHRMRSLLKEVRR